MAKNSANNFFSQSNTAGGNTAQNWGSEYYRRNKKRIDAKFEADRNAKIAQTAGALTETKDLGDKAKDLGTMLGKLFFENTAKLANTAAEGGRQTGELARAVTARATGNKSAERAAINRAMDDSQSLSDKGRGALGVGGFISSKEAEQGLSPKDFTKRVVGGGLGTAAEVVPFARGTSIAGKSGTKGARLARGAAEGAAYGAIGGTGQQLLDENGGVSLKEVAKDAGLGGVLGAVGTGIGMAAGKRGAANSGAITDEGRLLSSGQKQLPRKSSTTRLEQIDSEIENIRANGLGDRNPSEVRKLMRERNTLQQDINGAEAIQNVPKLDIKKPKTAQAVKDEVDNVERALSPNTPDGELITGKVNTLRDYVTSGMTDTFRRIGLKNTADKVEASFAGMRKEQVDRARQLRGWVRETKNSPGARERIFDALEGKTVNLNSSERKVADEMKAAFKQYADELGIPEEKRVSNYITRIFDEDLKGARKGENIDPALANILENRVGGDVSSPFLKRRTGKEGYKRDAFAAFDAYVQRASRQKHMQPAIDEISAVSKANKDIDSATADYLVKSAATLSGRRQGVDKFLDNLVDSTLGTNRGGTRALRGVRNLTYAGTMGGNVSSAIQNITQAANIFAEMGTRDTLAGYTKFARVMAEATQQKAAGRDVTALDELYDLGVLDDSIARESQQISGLKTKLQKADAALWAMFDATERMNRATAYYAAKNKALRKGLGEEAAQKAGIENVRKTQFKFNEIETPIGLQSEVAKTLAQFQSYNIRQSKYLLNTAKGALRGDTKDIARAVRWIGANAVVYGTVGQLIGMDWKNGIPFLSFRGVNPPLLQQGQAIVNAAQGQDQYNNDVGYGESIKQGAEKLASTLIPGGTQTKKTLEGLNASNQGFSTTDSGRVRFPVGRDGAERAQAIVFGQYSGQNARDFYKEGKQNLSAKQSETILEKSPEEQQQYYDYYLSSQGLTSKRKDTVSKVYQLVRDGQPEKARRLAAQYNNTVDGQLGRFYEMYDNIPDDIKDDVSDLKITYNSGLEKRAKRAKK